MLSRALPFHSNDRKQTFKLIKEADPDMNSSIWSKISEDCKHLIRAMLIKEPKDRISVDDALKDPFFRRHKIGPTYMKTISAKYVTEDKEMTMSMIKN